MLQSFTARDPNTPAASTPMATNRDFRSPAGPEAERWGEVGDEADPATRRSASGSEDDTPTELMERTSLFTLTLSDLRPLTTAKTATMTVSATTTVATAAMTATSMRPPLPQPRRAQSAILRAAGQKPRHDRVQHQPRHAVVERAGQGAVDERVKGRPREAPAP